jgi:hypothetical protein
MTWPLSPRVDLRNDRVPVDDALRQTRTAAEILQRFERQTGVILADEVGMGKTYVALAVAVSVLDATRRRNPVIVMVPPAVADKWPVEWAVFAERCLRPGHGFRATEQPVRRGSELLKLLDDKGAKKRHVIFLTHGALSSNLTDPLVRLALMRQATLRQPELPSGGGPSPGSPVRCCRNAGSATRASSKTSSTARRSGGSTCASGVVRSGN